MANRNVPFQNHKLPAELASSIRNKMRSAVEQALYLMMNSKVFVVPFALRLVGEI